MSIVLSKIKNTDKEFNQEGLAKSIVDNKEVTLEFDRKDLLKIIEFAGLSQALISYIQRSKEKLVEAGVDLHTLNTMRLQEFENEVFINLPDKAFEFILIWLAENSISNLNNFVKDTEENTSQRLLEYLFQLNLYIEDLRDEPPELRERARCYLACYQHEKYFAVLYLLHKVAIFDLSEENEEDGFQLITDLVYHPKKSLKEDAANMQNLIVACTIAIRNNDHELIFAILRKIKKLESLRNKDTVYNTLRNLYKSEIQIQNTAIEKSKIAQSGMFTKITSLQVLARCNKSLSNHKSKRLDMAFSRVVAVRADEKSPWYELSEEDAKKLFPTTGCIIHFDGKQYPQIPKRESFAVWEVSDQAVADQKLKDIDTHMFAHRKINAVHKVVYLEHITSSEKGKIRQWLRHTDDLKIEAEGERILRFEDNLFVHTINSYKHLIDENFKQELRAWHSLPLLELQDGTQLFIGSLPETKSNYHLTLPIDDIVSLIHSLSDINSSEKSKLSSLLYELGANQALNQRLTAIDKFTLERTNFDSEKLLELLTKTSYFQNKVTSKHSKDITGVQDQLTKLQAIYRQYKDLINKANAVKNKQNQQIQKFENLIEDRFKQIFNEDNRADLSNGGATNLIMLDYMQSLEDRFNDFVKEVRAMHKQENNNE